MNQPDPASAAIAFALDLTDPLDTYDFLDLWNTGDFPEIRDRWPEAPEEIYIGADPLHPQTVLEDPHPPARQAMPLGHPPSHWDEWAMRRARQLVQEINDVNHPPGQLTARLHCLLVDAMYYAAGEGDEDTARLGFIQANPDLSLRNLKNGRYWSLDGFSNYPQDTHHDVRAAIDAARREKDATP